MPVAPGLRRSGPFYIGSPKEPESEPDLDTYTIIFAALAFVICLRLRSVLGQRTGSERPSYLTGILLTLIAVALGAVFFDVGRANWYRAISDPTRVIDRYTAVALLVFYCILELLWWLWLDKKDRNGRPRYLTGISSLPSPQSL